MSLDTIFYILSKVKTSFTECQKNNKKIKQEQNDIYFKNNINIFSI